MTFQKRNGTQLRNAELAQIHIARQQLGLDDATYRDVLWAVARVRSSKDLDWRGRKQLLDHFRAKGWKPAPPRKAKAAKPVAGGQPGLVRLLWAELHTQGRVEAETDASLGAWLVRNHMPERPEWMNSAELNRAIEMLKKWRDRP